MKVGQLQTLFCQLIQGRGRDLSAKRTNIRIAQIVSDNQQNIRLRSLG